MTMVFGSSNSEALSLLLERSVSTFSVDLFKELTIRSANAQDAVQPAKRRRALLPSNPLRNSRLETHRNDEGAALASPLSIRDHCDRSPHASENGLVVFRELHRQISPRNRNFFLTA